MKSNEPEDLRGLLLPNDSELTYANYCREERNFAALLYARLIRPAGLRHFLGLLDIDTVDRIDEAEVFFEYAHARDLWHHFGQHEGMPANQRNAERREFIRKLIGAPEGFMAGKGVAEFNRFFIDERASTDTIQAPSRWDQRLFDRWAGLDGSEEPPAKDSGYRTVDFAKRICRLKWAFNAKADLVINLPDSKAVCVEIKVASGESVYRAGSGESSFKMTQTELQAYVLEELLGYETHFVLLTPRRTKSRGKAPEPNGPQALTWSEVLTALPDHDDELPFVGRMLGLGVLGVSDKAEEAIP